jgi:hypothetical protein
MRTILRQETSTKVENYAVLLHPTYRFILSPNGKFRRSGGSSNTGLLAYALEAICKSEGLWETFGAVATEPLYLRLLSEAIIEEDGTQWWRWEKKPSRPDYLYPFDWDDQFKAMDGLQAYASRRPERASTISFPHTNELIRRIFTCLYSSSDLGEDIKLVTSNKTALYMFDQSNGAKPGNKEDIFVAAVVLESADRYGLYNNAGFRTIALRLYERLLFAAKEGLTRRLPFHTLSRCYLSWAHYIYLLDKISNVLNINSNLNELCQLYDKFLAYSCPTILEQANERHDAYFRSLCGMKPLHRTTNSYLDDTVVYRHRRLGDYYSSPVWDDLLDLSEY